jgi:transcription elongation factor GreB
MQHHISKEGFEKFKAEWESLKYIERPAMQKQVSDAAAEGDRSENAAYTYGRMRLREIDRRLRQLDKLLDGARIVEKKAPTDGSIRFGAQIQLKEEKTEKMKTFSIVGGEEIDPLQGKISMKSPLGSSLLGKKAGEKIVVKTPRGELTYVILEVLYP